VGEDAVAREVEHDDRVRGELAREPDREIGRVVRDEAELAAEIEPLEQPHARAAPAAAGVEDHDELAAAPAAPGGKLLPSLPEERRRHERCP
jgi:hypothetical protein